MGISILVLGLNDSYELLELGINDIYRETLDTSIRLGAGARDRIKNLTSVRDKIFL